MDRVTVGLDLGDRYSRYCAIDEAGKLVEEGRVRTEVDALCGCFSSEPRRVVLEVGTHSPWVSRTLEELGHEVIVANPRRLRFIWNESVKTDRKDAEQLARVEQLCQDRYPATARLRGPKGVGALTALAFVLVVEDPSRFNTSRAVGPYLGLRPKQRQSGESDPQLGITKAGDVMLRRLLVGSVHYGLRDRHLDGSASIGTDPNLHRTT